MQLIVKHFKELSLEELHDIYRLRVAVFVVEQDCPYQEIDGKDKNAYHVWLSDEEGIQAYLRVLPPGISFPEVSIGRVFSIKRRQGLTTQLLREGIRVAKDHYHADKITIEAQVYARRLYENLGFVQTSEEFLEDGIPHIRMTLDTERL